jgi:23S rRNA pseudouridine1911/1915/1917 synthase
MLKNKTKNLVEIVKGEKPGAVKARTQYRTLGQVGKYFLVRLHPISGKSHQLRVHMRLIGSPVVGDVKYGAQSIQDPQLLLLHCRRMEFIHPIKQTPVILTAELPDHEWWNRYRKDIYALEQQD